MFEKFDEAANDVLASSRHECMRLRCTQVLPEHLLLALTRDPHNLASRALLSMNINADNVRAEVERLVTATGKNEPEPPTGLTSHLISSYETIVFSETVKKVFERANDYRLFLGRDKVAPEHLLLGIVDLPDHGAIRVLDEIGTNLTFLRRQVMSLIAREDSLVTDAPVARATVMTGIAEII